MRVMYKAKQEKYNLQGYDFVRINIIAICPECNETIGHLLVDNVKFCPFCGTQIDKENDFRELKLELFELNGEYLLKPDDIVIH